MPCRCVATSDGCLGGVRRAMLDNAQYAVAVPGGTDILIHARRAFREAVTSAPGMGVWVEVDVDFANAYPSLEHDSIDEAMHRLVPGVAPWCSWSHAEASTVRTPAGRALWSDRGAEQGDPMGSLQCGVALAGVRQRIA